MKDRVREGEGDEKKMVRGREGERARMHREREHARDREIARVRDDTRARM